MRRGTFVVFEGVEGAGKTTQIARLAEWLRAAGRTVVAVREPGGTAAGEEVRALLRAAREVPLAPVTELLLFNTARAELVAKVIEPALAEGHVVICDRFTSSTLAYQGYGRGLPLDMVRAANKIATGGLRADLTLFLDLEVAAGLRRKAGEDDDAYIGAEGLAFHERVRAGFRELAQAEGWVVVDAGREVEAVFADVRAAVEVRGEQALA